MPLVEDCEMGKGFQLLPVFSHFFLGSRKIQVLEAVRNQSSRKRSSKVTINLEGKRRYQVSHQQYLHSYD